MMSWNNILIFPFQKISFLIERSTLFSSSISVLLVIYSLSYFLSLKCTKIISLLILSIYRCFFRLMNSLSSSAYSPQILSIRCTSAFLIESLRQYLYPPIPMNLTNDCVYMQSIKARISWVICACSLVCITPILRLVSLCLPSMLYLDTQSARSDSFCIQIICHLSISDFINESDQHCKKLTIIAYQYSVRLQRIGKVERRVYSCQTVFLAVKGTQPVLQIFSFIKQSILMNNLKRPYQVLLNELISVDFNDRFVKSIDKWQSHSNQYLQSPQSLPHRAFSIFLFNKQNELLLQQRSVQKKTFPLCWTNTCCSHPNMIRYDDNQSMDEQSMRKALHRALIRELGMHISNQEFYFMEKILYKKQGEGGLQSFGEYQVDYVYLAKLEGEVNFKPVPQEIADIAWVNKQQFPSFISKVIKEGGYLSPWFLKMFESGKINQWWDIVSANQLKNFPGEDEKKVTNML